MSKSPQPSSVRSVLVVDDDGSARHALTVLFAQRGYAATAVAGADAARAELARRAFDLVLVDLALSGGIAVVEQAAPQAWVIGLGSAVETALPAIARGVHDCLSLPLRDDLLDLALRRAEAHLGLRDENAALKQALLTRSANPPTDEDAFARLIGGSARMAELGRTLRKIAEHKTTVLITGESGTGKELVARALHAGSPRRSGPFVTINCGAIPEALIESELFGHKKGAFTDAVRDKRGLFAEAHGGTLFLDEIGELALGPQVKLLRVLQEQMVRPVGSTEDEAVDVRVIAATMRDLAADVKAGRFREDLFYRLDVLRVELPPLRERREDLPQLVEHFLARANHKLGTQVRAIAPEAMNHILTYPWPGNVRELENTIERWVVLSEGETLSAEGLPERMQAGRDAVRELLASGELSIKKTVRLIEETLIRKALEATGGNRTNAAKRLEISHRALLYKMKAYRVGEGPLGPASRSGREKFDGEG